MRGLYLLVLLVPIAWLLSRCKVGSWDYWYVLACWVSVVAGLAAISVALSVQSVLGS